ncbi:MAG: BamA/TamA family outer membrane protein [Tatlockia sp.]|nr:BamA/TamA family outer membrane protein [Tatlockia sp.]
MRDNLLNKFSSCWHSRATSTRFINTKVYHLTTRVTAILSFVLVLGATPVPDFYLSGVKDKLLENIQSRLTDLNQTKPVLKETDAELRQEIEQAMQPLGYFKPQIIIKRQPLRIHILPGPPMYITSLNVQFSGEGATAVKLKKALEKLPIAQGQVFNSASYENAKHSLTDAAEKEGYLHSSFEKAEVLLDEANNSAAINLEFNTGTRYYFGQVKFDPTNISPELLHRFVPFSYGKPYSTAQILTLNNQLANSGYFRSITVKPQITGNDHYIPVEVKLQPAKRLSYSLGIGYGTDTDFRGRAGFNIIPVNSAGHKLSALGIGSKRQSMIQTKYTIPGKNPVTDEYQITGNLSRLNYDAGKSNSALLSFSQHHRLPQYKRILSINSLYDDYHYDNRSKEASFTLFPKASLTWLKKKKKLFSPSGYKINLTALGASKSLASHENFVQASLNVKAALTIPVIRTRFYFHTMHGFTQIDDINKLPLSLALFLGGADNLKGYSFNSINPAGPGKILTYAGLEIQKEFKENWYLVGFFDSGDVYKPFPKKLKNDIGIGLMWVSPLGPIKIGVAQPINSKFQRQSKYPRLVVSMGPDL